MISSSSSAEETDWRWSRSTRRPRKGRSPRCCAGKGLYHCHIKEWAAVLGVLNTAGNADLSIGQVWARELDEARYWCSLSSMYRIARAAAQTRERRAQATHPAKVKPELLADAPSQMWSWDITKLAGPIKGLWFHLYVLIDIYSRNTPNWMWMFCLRLSHSGKAVHIAYANQTQESFLDGHVRAFARLEGVPTGMIRYDNLKPAVIRVALGRERFEHPRFIAMRSHYGFDSFFYIPGIEGAHETGGVEGEIGRFRRRHLTPVPHLPSLAALNEALAAADAGNARHETAHDRLSALSLQCRIHAVEFPIKRDRGRRGGGNVREHPSNANRVGKTSCPDARILEHLHPSRLHREPRMPGTRVMTTGHSVARTRRAQRGTRTNSHHWAPAHRRTRRRRAPRAAGRRDFTRSGRNEDAAVDGFNGGRDPFLCQAGPPADHVADVRVYEDFGLLSPPPASRSSHSWCSFAETSSSTV